MHCTLHVESDRSLAALRGRAKSDRPQEVSRGTGLAG